MVGRTKTRKGGGQTKKGDGDGKRSIDTKRNSWGEGAVPPVNLEGERREKTLQKRKKKGGRACVKGKSHRNGRNAATGK